MLDNFSPKKNQPTRQFQQECWEMNEKKTPASQIMNCASVVSVVTVGKHHHTENTVWMIWAVGGFSHAVEFVIWCANKKCATLYVESNATLSHCWFFGVYLQLSRDITGCNSLSPPAVSGAQMKGDGEARRSLVCVSEHQKCATHTQLCWSGEPSTSTTEPQNWKILWRVSLKVREDTAENGSSGAGLVRFWACSWRKDCSWALQVYWWHLVNV